KPLAGNSRSPAQWQTCLFDRCAAHILATPALRGAGQHAQRPLRYWRSTRGSAPRRFADAGSLSAQLHPLGHCSHRAGDHQTADPAAPDRPRSARSRRLEMQAVSRRVRKIVRWSMIIIVGAGIGGFLFAWSGLYNVAASSGHWAIVDLLLRFGMRNSVALRATAIEVPRLDSPDLIALGAAHFHQIGSASC